MLKASQGILMNIIALMPTSKVMEIAAVQSLVSFQSAIYNKKDNVTVVFSNGFNAAKARTFLLKYASEQVGTDWIVWLDSDHVYNATVMYDMISKMEKNGLDILSAKYYVRDATLNKTTAHGNFSAEGFKKYNEPIDGELIDCDVVGLGFCVMRPSLVKKLIETYGTDLFKFDIDDNSTEDVYFCRQLRKLGTRICFDNKNLIGHLTTVLHM
jgi:choline kinase